MARLRNSGYANDFTALPDGNLVCRSCGTQQAPETIDVRETVRFEGDRVRYLNPDERSSGSLIQKALAGMRQLDEDDMLMLLGFINRLLKN